jgi:HSP20 family protein
MIKRKEDKKMPFRNLVPSLWRKTDAPVRREDEHPFFSLQRDMNRLFDDFFRGFDLTSVDAAGERFKSFVPSVDVKEDEKEVTVKAELPGMDEKDIKVLLTESALTLNGEKKEEKEDKGKDYYHMERSYGSFRRVIPLPAGIDMKKVKAGFKNGVLTVRLPKTEEAATKGKKIPVTAE